MYIADRGNGRIVNWCIRGDIALWIRVVVAGLSVDNLGGIALDNQGRLFFCDGVVYHWAVGATGSAVGASSGVEVRLASDPMPPPIASCAIDGKGRVLATFNDSFPGNGAQLLVPPATVASCLVDGSFDSVIAVSSVLWNRNSHKHFPRWQRSWARFVYWCLVRGKIDLSASLACRVIGYALVLFVPAHFQEAVLASGKSASEKVAAVGFRGQSQYVLRGRTGRSCAFPGLGGTHGLGPACLAPSLALAEAIGPITCSGNRSR